MDNSTNNSDLDSVVGKIKVIVNALLGIPITELHLDDRFVEDLRADSLAMLELRSAIEDKLDLVITDEDVVHLSTVRSAAEYVVRKNSS